MKKNIAIIVNSNPDSPKFGFGDLLYLSVEGEPVKIFHCSASPNPPMGKYGWLDECDTYFECVQHSKFGKCLLLHGGRELPSRISNPNQGGKKILTEVFIHPSNIGYQNPKWRGSRGCVTLERGEPYDNFISLFAIGDKGYISITNFKQKESTVEKQKNILKSKTFYLNIIGILIEAIQVLTGEQVIPTGVSTIAVALLNIIMRRISKDRVKFFK